jgi:hypothetical protein
MKNLTASLLFLVLLAACSSKSPGATPTSAPAPEQNDPTAQWPRIYLHFDYMVSDHHSHEPSAEALQLVVDAFKKREIILDIDPIHNAIPESLVTTLAPNVPACTGNSSVDISELKAKYYVPRNILEHYAVFAHYNTCGNPQDCRNCQATQFTSANPPFGTTGIAKVIGYDFIVSLGQLVDVGLDPMPPLVDAGSLMHELGHNLGLRHGGGDDLNQKPNYISVMNYTYQFGIGVLNAHQDNQGQTTTSDLDFADKYVVDYSANVLPSLNEGTLDHGRCVSNNRAGLKESVGISMPEEYIMVHYTSLDGATRYSLGNGSPIDWDGDGMISSEDKYGDISADGQCSVLAGFDDWTAIKKYLAKEASLISK